MVTAHSLTKSRQDLLRGLGLEAYKAASCSDVSITCTEWVGTYLETSKEGLLRLHPEGTHVLPFFLHRPSLNAVVCKEREPEGDAVHQEGTRLSHQPHIASWLRGFTMVCSRKVSTLTFAPEVSSYLEKESQSPHRHCTICHPLCC